MTNFIVVTALNFFFQKIKIIIMKFKFFYSLKLLGPYLVSKILNDSFSIYKIKKTQQD